MKKRSMMEAVLIIEDDVDVLNFATRVLEIEGYQVFQTEDGEKGIKLAGENHVALLLLDLRLPSVDGWWVLARMKSEPELSAIPVVVFTAAAGVSQRDRAFDMGAAEYLVKPLSAGSLRKAVATILHKDGDLP